MMATDTVYLVLVTTKGGTPILRISYRTLSEADESSRSLRARWSPDYLVKMLIIR